ncbi:MAG: hypothetical protein HY520_03260 [Candidatus Aenigmarchaeota archaeon]|nr:hypothetical protein [Candidatus Aenigmarchaeota archaeon]
MTTLQQQEELFTLIGDTCRKKVEAIVIGGSAMLYYNFSKTATKGIDLVVGNEADRTTMIAALDAIGFRKDFSPSREGEPYRLAHQDTTIDLFAARIFKMTVSEPMRRRMTESIDFHNLSVLVLSPEDIILSKCMTDRQGDRLDAAAIVREAKVAWDIILAECLWQSAHGDRRFVVYLRDFLDDLRRQFGIAIPKDVLDRLQQRYAEFLESLGSAT